MATDPETHHFPLGKLNVALKKPTQAQLLVLLSLPGMIEDGENANATMLYGDALGALFADPEVLQTVRRQLLKGKLEAEEFIQLGMACMKHFYPSTSDEAPKAGPVRRARRA